MTHSDLIDITVELVHETDLAILVDDGTNRVWLPKSACEYTIQKNRIIEVTLKERLALEKGLI